MELRSFKEKGWNQTSEILAPFHYASVSFVAERPAGAWSVFAEPVVYESSCYG